MASGLPPVVMGAPSATGLFAAVDKVALVSEVLAALPRTQDDVATIL